MKRTINLKLLLPCLIMISSAVFVNAVKAQSIPYELESGAAHTRLIDDESFVQHEFVIQSSANLGANDLSSLMWGISAEKTLLLICDQESFYDDFQCGKDHAKSQTSAAREILINDQGDNVLLVNMFEKKYIVVPENIMLHSNSNNDLYNYLVSFERNFETNISKQYTRGTSLIREITELFFYTALIGLFFLFIYLQKGLDVHKLIKNIPKSRIFELNAYAFIMGIGITLTGLLLVSIKDVQSIDFQYIQGWLNETLNNLSRIEPMIVLVALFLYFSMVLSILVIATKILFNFKRSLLGDVKKFAKNVRIEILVFTILVIQILTTLFFDNKYILFVSLINLQIILILIFLNKNNSSLYTNINKVWRALFLAGCVLYVIIILLVTSGFTGNKQIYYSLVTSSDNRSFISPKEFELTSNLNSQHLDSNGPIFLNDILVFHPGFESIKYVDINDVSIDNNVYIVESDEERLINALLSNHERQEFYKEIPSSYFMVGELVSGKDIELSLECSKYLEPRQLKLSIFSQSNNDTFNILFFPGCYRPDLSFNINLPEEYFVPGYVYKIEGIPSGQIGNISIDNVLVEYLNLDKIRNREKFSVFTISTGNGNGDELIVGTSEGSYLKRSFSDLINSNFSEEGLNIVPTLTTLVDQGDIKVDELVTVDSIYDGVQFDINSL